MLAPRKTLWSTPISAISVTARLADLKEFDKLYDIGCGDGRVIIHLAKTTACRQFVGVEIDPDRAREAQQNILNSNLDPNVQVDIRCENALGLDLSDATVVFLYLIPRGLKLIKPVLANAVEARRLLRRKKEGETTEARNSEPLLKVVTYMSNLIGEKYIAKDSCTVEHQKGAEWPIYLYHFN